MEREKNAELTEMTQYNFIKMAKLFLAFNSRSLTWSSSHIFDMNLFVLDT